MTQFKVLIEGYARVEDGITKASSTVTLIEDSSLKIIVDPGIDRKLLLQKLSESKIKLEDINYVFLTHYHPDHAFLASLFPRAKLVDGTTIYDNDEEKEYLDKIPGTEVKVIATPGHTIEHYSLVLETSKGIVVVAGDVFWWFEGEQKSDNITNLIGYNDPYGIDSSLLKENRKRLLQLADFIIPGHGRMFKNVGKIQN